jgi:threonine/homoserine/homoserine lactone efflux protein
MFLQGFVLGISIAAPVGPIGLLCIQRTLSRGRIHGFASGLGAASADLCYALIAAFWLGTIGTFLLSLQLWLQIAGGVFLVGLGLKIARAAPVARAAAGDRVPGLAHAWGSTFLLTLTNPMTILSFFAAFAALGLGASPGGPTGARALVAGVFLGSTLWWLLLSFFAGLARARLTAGRLRFLNLAAGGIIMLLGLWALVSAVRAKLLS